MQLPNMIESTKYLFLKFLSTPAKIVTSIITYTHTPMCYLSFGDINC